jgi:hypothetical protein
MSDPLFYRATWANETDETYDEICSLISRELSGLMEPITPSYAIFGIDQATNFVAQTKSYISTTWNSGDARFRYFANDPRLFDAGLYRITILYAMLYPSSEYLLEFFVSSTGEETGAFNQFRYKHPRVLTTDRYTVADAFSGFLLVPEPGVLNIEWNMTNTTITSLGMATYSPARLLVEKLS